MPLLCGDQSHGAGQRHLTQYVDMGGKKGHLLISIYTHETEG